MPVILGLETSCDETAASVVGDGLVVRSNVVSTQHELHERYGGVVPEIASRAHLERLWPVVRAALDQAGIALSDLDAIAVGNRPGLVGSLIVGASAAKTLAWSLNLPLIGIDHVQAHLYAAALRESTVDSEPPTGDASTKSTAINHQSPIINPPSYPALGLVVSGGHTSLFNVASPTAMTCIGKTIDDAVGEAYDKAAVILDAGYPGGPNLDRLAQQGDATAAQTPKLPRPLLGPGSLDFSFSGLKTALLYATRGTPTGRGKARAFPREVADLSEAERANLAAAFQSAVVDTLMTKLKRAVRHMDQQGQRPGCIIVGGGVSANSLLRTRVVALGEKLGLAVFIPPMSLCVDNAAMIAGLAHAKLAAGQADDLSLPVIATTSVGLA
ncbi:MAG: tRNA (adenosine(37)-N6)-threonylcarbamoyltransferase complex transferase subunit TsaD [Phycisphaerales bacterium JB063]